MSTVNDIVENIWARIVFRFIVPTAVLIITGVSGWALNRVIATLDDHGKWIQKQNAAIQKQADISAGIETELRMVQEQNVFRFTAGTTRFDKIETKLESMENRLRDMEITRGRITK